MYRLIKRIVDFLFAGILILLLSPLLLGVSLIVVLSSGFPVLFIQKRVGTNKVLFNIYKFRTMLNRKNIDQYKESVLSSSTDSRVTKVGRFLRKTSLDELPQLLNILKGNMSFVGPRPIIPEQLNAIPRDESNSRFDVKPGITGLSQVKGRRNLPWPLQLEYDAKYVKDQSFVIDMTILMKTVIVLLKNDDVYGDATLNWRNYIDQDKQ